MLRSLFAIIFSVIIGLSTAKFVEGGGIALIGEDAGVPYLSLLVFSWFIAAFIASSVAILIGRRWAPLGVLAAVTIFFSAFMTLLSAQLSWVMWPAAAVASFAGGAIALRLTNARNSFPKTSTNDELFGGN